MSDIFLTILKSFRPTCKQVNHGHLSSVVMLSSPTPCLSYLSLSQQPFFPCLSRHPKLPHSLPPSMVTHIDPPPHLLWHPSLFPTLQSCWRIQTDLIFHLASLAGLQCCPSPQVPLLSQVPLSQDINQARTHCDTTPGRSCWSSVDPHRTRFKYPHIGFILQWRKHSGKDKHSSWILGLTNSFLLCTSDPDKSLKLLMSFSFFNSLFMECATLGMQPGC